MKTNKMLHFVCGVLVAQGIVVTCVNGCDFLCGFCRKNQQIESENGETENDGEENSENENNKETENKEEEKNEDESKKETKPKCPSCNSIEVSNERKLCKKCCKDVRCGQRGAGGYIACVSSKNLMMRECGCIVCGNCYSNNKCETCKKCKGSFCNSFACEKHARCSKCEKIFCLNDEIDKNLVSSIVGYLDKGNVNTFKKTSFICDECNENEKCCYWCEGKVCTNNARFLLSCDAKNHFICKTHFGTGEFHVKCCYTPNLKGNFIFWGGHWLCKICLQSDKENHIRCGYDSCKKIICGKFREKMIDGKYCSQECEYKDNNSSDDDSD